MLHEIDEIQRYIKENKSKILDEDIYELKKFVPSYNRRKFENDLNIVEAYCMNILLSYAAEQHSVYQGKRYSALTIDYGYFYSTTITESDRYYNYANLKPRIFLLGREAYYHDLYMDYRKKIAEIGDFDCPKELKKELTYYVQHKDKKDESGKDFIKYAKSFEKKDDSRDSLYGSMSTLAKKVNPLLRMNPMDKVTVNNVGSFEIGEYFTQKKFLGVCSMLAAGQGWKVDTVRAVTIILGCCAGLGVLGYFALALAKKCGFYFGVNIMKP